MKSYLKNITLLLAVLLPTIAVAYDFEVDGIYYNINNNGTVSVTYKYYNSGSPQSDYSGEITIPGIVTYNGSIYSVTSIGKSAFHNCSSLTSVILPNTITYIEDYAFQSCSSLINISLPNSLTNIGNCVFEYCSSLPTICIPNSVQYMMTRAFAYCTSLNSIILPNSVNYIGAQAFINCSALTNVTIPSSITVLNSGVFEGCKSLQSITIPNTISKIEERAFCDCFALSSVSLPSSILTIGKMAFYRCGLNSISIPNSVISIGDIAFRGCSGSLTSIIVESGNQYYDSRDNCNAIIETSSNKMIVGCLNSTIPNSVTSIGNYTFEGCSGLTNLEIPSSVTSIGNNAFYDCRGLTCITIPSSVTSIGQWAFYGCLHITSITIGSSVTSIGDYAFYGCYNLTNMTLCGDIVNVGSNIIDNNRPKSLFITKNVSSIPNFGFAPTNIYCYASIPPTCQDGTFSAYTGALHVPATSLSAYFTAPIWENFDDIMGDAVEPLSVTISKTDLEIPLGETALLTATVLPNNAYPNTITWSSSNTGVATVENGTVNAVSAGECDIIATCLDKRSICHVVVKDVTISIYLDQNEARVLPNHIITLTPTASSEVLPELTISSSDPSIASGRVTNGIIRIVGIREGTTTITVGSADGTAIPATCLVTVYTELGDLNCDGFVNISDVTALISYILSNDGSSVTIKNADVNNDGNINISDVTMLISKILKTISD